LIRTVGGIELVHILRRSDHPAERSQAGHAQRHGNLHHQPTEEGISLPEWQTAIEALMLCSRSRDGHTMLGRIGVMKALHRLLASHSTI
jgi:hypothetical protein